MSDEKDEKAGRVYPQRCRTCNHVLTSPAVCMDCHQLYDEAASADHFHLLGLSRRYEIDEAELERRFLELSRALHPDYFAAHGENVLMVSMQLTSKLNEAYRVLKDPLQRAGYLLELFGGPTAAADKSVPEGLLPEMMLLREQLEEARLRGDNFVTNGWRPSLRWPSNCRTIRTNACGSSFDGS